MFFVSGLGGFNKPIYVTQFLLSPSDMPTTKPTNGHTNRQIYVGTNISDTVIWRSTDTVTDTDTDTDTARTRHGSKQQTLPSLLYKHVRLKAQAQIRASWHRRTSPILRSTEDRLFFAGDSLCQLGSSLWCDFFSSVCSFHVGREE